MTEDALPYESHPVSLTINWSIPAWSSFILLCLAGIYYPFIYASFEYWQLILARLGVTLLPLGVLALANSVSESFRSFQFERANALNDFFLRRGLRPPFKDLGRFQIAFTALLCLLAFCLKQPTVWASDHSQRVATILFLTGRAGHRDGVINGAPTVSFGVDPAKPQSVSYGAATVLIQWADGFFPVHYPLLTPFVRTPDRQTVFQYAIDMSKEEFIAAVPPASEILLFVHGFHVPFNQAMNTAANLSFDLRYSGVLIAFSWPSGNEILSYDHENASESIPDLSSLIEMLPATHPAKVNFLAHSMGGRVLGKAFSLIEERGHKLPDFDNLVFAAPDVNFNTFDNFASAVQRSAKHVTIYISAGDRALWGSGQVHRGPRVGYERQPTLVWT